MLESILRVVILVVCLPGIPLLGLLAFRGWTRNFRRNLPGWRNKLGVISIALSLVGWFALLTPAFFHLMGFGTSWYGDTWEGAVPLSAATGTTLALALRGLPRVQAVAAGLLVIILWFSNQVQ